MTLWPAQDSFLVLEVKKTTMTNFRENPRSANVTAGGQLKSYYHVKLLDYGPMHRSH